jgi:hypothetical protein
VAVCITSRRQSNTGVRVSFLADIDNLVYPFFHLRFAIREGANPINTHVCVSFLADIDNLVGPFFHLRFAPARIGKSRSARKPVAEMIAQLAR